MKYLCLFLSLLSIIPVSAVPSKEEQIEVKLAVARSIAKDSARMDNSAGNFHGNESFAHYRSLVALLEKSHCRGAYASRCEESKKAVSQEALEPFTAQELHDGVAKNAAAFSLLRACAEGCENAHTVNEFLDTVDRELFLANPAQYKEGYAGFITLKAFGRVERMCSEIDSESLFGLNSDKDTEEEVAAAEARLKEAEGKGLE